MIQMTPNILSDMYVYVYYVVCVLYRIVMNYQMFLCVCLVLIFVCIYFQHTLCACSSCNVTTCMLLLLS